ncbi:MAG TPA: hypothetical protein VF342_06845 [Alphaproteobacteria bacterium]
MRRLAAVCLLGAVLALPAAAQTPCGPAGYPSELADAWLKRRSVASPGEALTMAEGICIRARLVDLLAKTQGKPIGYKVGLTSPAAQQTLGVNTPVAGILLEKMIVADGAVVPANFGARPIFESDLIATVRDEGVNDANSPLDVAAHIVTIQPFIELADLMLAEGQKMTGAIVAAINVGARRGVVGDPVLVRAEPAFVDALANMEVTLTDGSGAELGKAPGRAILGHPFNAVIFLAKDLAARGQRLKAGDVISLGSFGRPLPPKAGQKVTARYEGLPTGPMTVSVSFK